jgi:hypothetical protein
LPMPTARRSRLGVCTLVVVAGLLAGCGGSGSGSSTTTTSSAASAKGVVLGADGLGIVQTGDAQTPAVQAVSRYLGPPTKTTTPGPCNGTTEVEWSDLSLEFSHGVLDGYRYMEGGLSDAGAFRPPTGPGTPVLKTATGATLGMTLAEVRPLYPAGDFSEEQNGSILLAGTKAGERLFLGFFSSTRSTPLIEIKGGNTCGNV